MYAASLLRWTVLSTAGVCVARCVYPGLFPGEDSDCDGDWDGDAEACLWDRVGDMVGDDPDDYLSGLACADADPGDDEVDDAAARGLLGAGF